MSSASLPWVAPNCAADTRSCLRRVARGRRRVAGTRIANCVLKWRGSSSAAQRSTPRSRGAAAALAPDHREHRTSGAEIGRGGPLVHQPHRRVPARRNSNWRPYVTRCRGRSRRRCAGRRRSSPSCRRRICGSTSAQRAVARHHASLKCSASVWTSLGGRSRVEPLAHAAAARPAVGVPGRRPPRQQGALAPLLDLFNHAAAPSLGAATTDVENGVLEIRAARRSAAARRAPAVRRRRRRAAERAAAHGLWLVRRTMRTTASRCRSAATARRRELLRRLRLADAPTRLGYPPRGGGAAAEPPMQALLVARVHAGAGGGRGGARVGGGDARGAAPGAGGDARRRRRRPRLPRRRRRATPRRVRDDSGRRRRRARGDAAAAAAPLRARRAARRACSRRGPRAARDGHAAPHGEL